jgi:hypothetical protein
MRCFVMQRTGVHGVILFGHNDTQPALRVKGTTARTVRLVYRGSCSDTIEFVYMVQLCVS